MDPSFTAVSNSIPVYGPILVLLLAAIRHLYLQNQILHKERLDDHKAHSSSLLAVQTSTLTAVTGATTVLSTVKEMLAEQDDALDEIHSSLPHNGSTRRTKP